MGRFDNLVMAFLFILLMVLVVVSGVMVDPEPECLRSELRYGGHPALTYRECVEYAPGITP